MVPRLRGDDGSSEPSFFHVYFTPQIPRELTTGRQRLNSQESGFEGRPMGLFFYFVLFIVACFYGWYARSGS
jgi:hypothetical protein